MKKHIKLFENWSGEKVTDINILPQSGSDRKYYRITGTNKVAMGVSNPDKKENIAFLSFTKTFIDKNLTVPKIYAEQLDENIYLLEDLGDTTLYIYMSEIRKTDVFPQELIGIYKTILEELPKFQIMAGKELDYGVCYPRASFDKQSMMWDLNYFKYYFLKLAKVPYDEQALEDDFHKLTDYLLEASRDFFLYRDFQSRNIMLKDNKVYFIDYQGGRKGALQYDLASLLYDAKADIPQRIRDELLEHYIENVKKYTDIKEDEFKQYYYGYVLIRIMQAMGAFGFRGFYEKKEHFLQSIPFAIENLRYVLKVFSLPIQIPALVEALEMVTVADGLKKFGRRKSTLKVTIYSFSYKKGIPKDDTDNGGGFVFDCRAMHNPGRYDEYKQMTGKDKAVVEFLKKESETDQFLNNVYALVDQSVEKYQQRNFTNLMVSFGCTGGQHRSVYCADMLAKYLKEKYNTEIVVHHREQENLTFA